MTEGEGKGGAAPEEPKKRQRNPNEASRIVAAQRAVLAEVKRRKLQKHDKRHHKPKRHDGFDFTTLTINSLTLAAAVAAAFAAIWLAVLTHQSLGETRNEFHHDQRAWLGILLHDPADKKPRAAYYYTAPDGQHYIAWNYWVHNYGKSPAYELNGEDRIYVGGEWYTTAIRYGQRAPISPSGDFYRTVSSPPTNMTKAQFDAAIKRDDFVAITVYIRYSDVYGSDGVSSICVKLLGDGAPQFCAPGKME